MTDRAETAQPRSVLATVEDEVLQLIDLALAEDRGPNDWTSRWIVPARMRIRARVIAKAEGVIAGLTPSVATFLRLDGRIEATLLCDEGEHVTPGQTVYEVRGPGRSVLTAERVALNFLQRLSGIATLTREYVDAVAGTGTRILDTRKTTPGWREIEKAAVRAGGGMNHRRGLYDAVLIKDNHLAVAGGIAEAVTRVRDNNTRGLPVIVEVRTLEDVELALAAAVDRLLLDNMELDVMREAVQRIRKKRSPRPETEASGNVDLARVRAIAATGVDFVSIGALTHSAPALDVSMEVIRP